MPARSAWKLSPPWLPAMYSCRLPPSHSLSAFLPSLLLQVTALALGARILLTQSHRICRWLLSELPAQQMEYPVVAPSDGEVKAILVEGSQLTHQGDALLVLAAK